VPPDAQYTTWELADFTAFCVAAKQQVMADASHETETALVLEYGHTIGHVIEVLTPGPAVGMGMLAAAR
jgi:3-dehydroquinate synthase/2-deoxy-scyllo-inosose synthase